MSDALPWFPLVGCLIGSTLYWLARGFSLVSGDWHEGTAGIVIIGSVLLTRGFHLDGLADWADGFGGGRDKEQTLTIMKDSHVGAFGVVTIVLVLLAKWMALLRLLEVGSFHWIISAYIVSRTAMVELAVRLPYARAEGGTGEPFVVGGRFSHRVGALFFSLISLFASSALAGLILLGGGLIACWLLGFWFRRHFGGVTGDLLGACCELVETGLLFSCAITGHRLSQFASWRVISL